MSANYFPAQIWIGGQLSRTAKLSLFDDVSDTILQGLIAALHEDGASHNYGDVAIDENCTEEGLGAYLTDDGKLLHLSSAEAYNGEFQKTEQFCIDHGIPFDRNSDHYCEYDGENVHWRPGMNAPKVTYADANGDEIVDGATARAAMALLDAVVDPASEADASTVFHEARRLLHDACPDLPPELEVFNLST